MSQLKITKHILILFSTILAVACSKDRPYDAEKNKTQNGLIEKASISDHMSQEGYQVFDAKTGKKFSLSTSDQIPLKNQYLGVVSTTSTDFEAPVTPYEVGRPVRLVLSFTKDSLVAYEIPDQFVQTDLNFTPFIKIPVDHVGYRCREDANGKCTGVEEKDEETPWVKRSFFKPNFEKIEMLALDGMFSSFINYAIQCSKTLDTKVINYTIEEEAINITIEKTMQQSFVCSGFTGLINPKAVTYRMRQNISMVKLNTLATKDYRPVLANDISEDKFGYFKSTVSFRDSSNRLCKNCVKEYIDRFNPQKRTVEFALTENFYKPENAGLKAATEFGIKVINEGLKESGAKMRISLLDKKDNLIEGDIRTNLISMVEDPITRGLLGYGPSIPNPLTGEIVHARTVMFPGVMKRYIEQAYDQFVDLARQNQTAANGQPGATGIVPVFVGDVPADRQAQAKAKATGLIGKLVELPADSLQGPDLLGQIDFDHHDLHKEPHVGTDHHIDLIEQHYAKSGLDNIKLQHTLNEYSRLNYYPAELFNSNAAFDEELAGMTKETNYRFWNELNANEQNKIVSKLLPIVWIPTFIHELGHNLGLRHNFSGSMDRDNFYTQRELFKRGIDRQLNYSSVMDYSYSSANQLSIMGKYDVAALKYAYAEKVELANGVELPLKEAVKRLNNKTLNVREEISYEYCTDEHAGLSANCNRFDEGTNLLEIVRNTIEDYRRYYERRNFKGDRYRFDSMGGDIGYVGSIGYRFRRLRLVFESFESISKRFNLDPGDEIWNTNDFLRDLKAATVEAGLFLVDVLKTSDIQCLISTTAAPNEGVAIVAIQRLSPWATNCAGAQEDLSRINPALLIMGQAGKSFNHLKDLDNPLAEVDEIDVRGIWIDKMMALNTLLGRYAGLASLDNEAFNFLLLPELQGPILGTLLAIATDNVRGDLTFKTIFGNPLLVRNWEYSLYTEKTHQLDKQYHPYMRWRFGLNNGPTIFQRHTIRAVKHLLKSDLDPKISEPLSDAFGIFTEVPGGRNPAEFTAYQMGSQVLFAHPTNAVAMITINKINALRTGEKLLEAMAMPPEHLQTEEEKAAWTAEINAEVQQIAQIKRANPAAKAPFGTSPVGQIAYTMDGDSIDETLAGNALPIDEFYHMILNSLK